MKNRKKMIFLFSNFFMLLNTFLNAQVGHNEDPHFEWFEGDDVAVNKDGFYAASNKGMIKLNVVEYDQINNRYKVLCSCLQRRGCDPIEALSVPYEGDSK